MLVACRLGLSYLQCSVLSSDNGLSLQSCSPGETLDKLPAVVATSQKAIPHHIVGKRAMRGPCPFVRTYLRAYAHIFVIGQECTWVTQTGTETPTRQILTQTQKHTSTACSFIGRLSVWCRAASNSCVSSPARVLSKHQQRDRQCPLLSLIIWHNAFTVTLALMYSDGHTANSHPVPSSAPPQLARTSTLLIVNTFHSCQIP